MALIIQPEAPPLRQDASGALRVGSSRVLVELVIWAFQDGATPEAIAQRYPTATLADIYAVIAYYLRHRQEVDAYLAEREQQAQVFHILLVAPQRVPLAARRGFVGGISPAPLGTLELATRLPGAPQTCVLAQAKQNTRSIVINFQSISPQEV